MKETGEEKISKEIDSKIGKKDSCYWLHPRKSQHV